jgi:O-antigen ligase
MLLIVNLKALVVVLALASFAFAIAKPFCLRFMLESDFARRRNVWFVLTACAFLSPSFWLFLPVAAGLLLWSVRRDSNPVALYLLFMHLVSPSVKVEIPVVGINELFGLDMYRVLAFTVLIPVLLRGSASNNKDDPRRPMDVMLVAYAVLQMLLLAPYETVTNTLRRGLLFCLDSLFVYFAFSRALKTRRELVDALATFCLAGALYCPLAVFETVKSWQLYREIGAEWGSPQVFPYLFREGVLRAFVSAGHALSLGYLIAVAFGFWLYLSSRLESASRAVWGAAWMWMGLLATYSRAPWLVAASIFVIYSLVSPGGLGRLLKVSAACAVLALPMLFSPLGQRAIDNLPFIGTVEAETVTYREELFDASWRLIKKNPLFGDPFFILNLEDLRQGQGIIDLVNSYATIAMQYGVVGLCLLLLPFLIGMHGVFRWSRRSARDDADFACLGSCLLACMFGTLGMMATGGFGNGLAQMYFVLAGLAGAYACLARTEAATKFNLQERSRAHPAGSRTAIEA